MKLSSLSFLLLIAGTDAGINTPTLSVDLQGLDGSSGPFEGLDPEISWSASTSAAGCDFEAGVVSSCKPTLDVLSLPKNVWGTVKSEIAGWGVAAKTSLSLGDSSTDIAVRAKNDDIDTSVQVVSAGGGNKIQISKGFGALGGRVAVTPRYNTKTSVADAVIDYDGDISVKVEASAQKQKLTVSKQVSDTDTLTPSITSAGDVSVAWKKSLSAGNSLTATVAMNDSVSVKWEDGPWTATIASALDGSEFGEVDVKINRKISFI